MADVTLDIPDERLIERAVRNARWKRGVPRWSAIADAFGLGATYANLLCIRFGIDPDEIRGRRKR